MRLAFLFSLALLGPLAAQEGAAWLTDFEAAKAAAKKDGKVILADFTGSDWCSWCIKLHDEVFSKPEFQEWAAKKVVLLELDEGADRPDMGGTICIGLADTNGTFTRQARLVGGRDWVRIGATELGLDCLRRHLLGLPVDERIDFERR